MQPGPAPAPPPVPIAPMVLGTAALVLLVTAAGLVDWPLPRRADTSGWWSVTGVTGPLWALVGGTVVVTVVAAVALTAGPAGLRWRDPVSVLWLLVLLVFGAALAWNALGYAELGTTLVDAVIPVLDLPLVTVPAGLASLLFIRRGARVQRAAVVGTGLVTLPLLHLGWVLLASGVGGSPLRALWPTTVSGVLPLAFVAWVGVLRGPRSGAAPAGG